MQSLKVLAIAMLALSVPSGAAERSVEVESGVRIAVADEGPVGGPPIVLLPGWGMSRHVWRKQVAALSGRFRIVVIEPRSQGRSSTVTGDVSPEARARDIANVLAKLDLEHVTLVAWSQGVQDASSLIMGEATSRIDRIMLIDALPSAGPGMAAKDAGLEFSLAMSNVILQQPAAYAEGMVDAIFSQPLAAADRRRFVADVLRTPSAVGVAAMLASLYGADRQPQWRVTCVPVLVVASGLSKERSAMRDFAASLPDGSYAEVEGGGHALFFDQPERFNDLLTAFAQKSKTGPSSCAAAPAGPAAASSILAMRRQIGRPRKEAAGA